MIKRARKLKVKKKKYSKSLQNQETNFIINIVIFGGLICIGLFGSIIFSKIELSQIGTFNTILTSILMQAFPFMLIGVLISSFMHIFIPDEWIVKIFPKKYGIGFITALFGGLFLPVCECAIVPVMTRLIKKGVPTPIAITFMLSAPIINPIVIFSTLYAFPDHPEITAMRVYFGLLIALIAGLVMCTYGKDLPIFLGEDYNELGSTCNHIHSCSCHNHHDIEWNSNSGIQKLRVMFLHAGDEFFRVGKYLVFGAFIATCMQTMVPREIFDSLGSQTSFALLIMMLMAFLFSACSTSDAFIARSFTSRFSMGAVMGFLVFGPMMDVKNLFMLFAHFKKGFVLRLAIIIVVLNLLVLTIMATIYL